MGQFAWVVSCMMIAVHDWREVGAKVCLWVKLQ